MKILIAYLKKETVLCIAVLLAAFSMLLIHPDSKYSGYMDYRTLALLFSLMTIMEGFKQTGFFADVAWSGPYVSPAVSGSGHAVLLLLHVDHQ